MSTYPPPRPHACTRPTTREQGHVLGLALKQCVAEIREKAVSDLLALSNSAIPFLRRAANSPKGKTSEQLQRALELADEGALTPLPSVASRLLALRRPAGAAAALLNFLPCAEDEYMR
jgi:hypothetical protein